MLKADVAVEVHKSEHRLKSLTTARMHIRLTCRRSVLQVCQSKSIARAVLLFQVTDYE